jgi:DNA-binding response OmpR family regulator
MQKKILVVDDDPAVLDIYKIIFEKAGYTVQLITNGNKLLTQKPEAADMYILDKQLSGVDGLDICRHLKNNEHTRETPVILVSATPAIDKYAAHAGADDFIEKPFQTRQLLAKVAHFLANTGERD